MTIESNKIKKKKKKRKKNLLALAGTLFSHRSSFKVSWSSYKASLSS